MTSVNKAVDFFRNKQYAKCVEILRREISEIEFRDNDTFTIQSLILENNIIVCEFLECNSLTNLDTVKELNKFYDLHKKCSALQNLGKLYPIQLHITYNLLWLHWIDLDNKYFYFLPANALDEIITNCLKIVLRDLEFSIVGVDMMDSNEKKLFLMKHLGYQLLQIPSSEIVIFLELYIVIALVSVKSNIETNNIIEYTKLLSFFKSSWQLVTQKIEDSKPDKNSVFSSLFKFELFTFKSDEIATILFQAISITSAMCYFKFGDMDECFKCLEISEYYCKFPFIFNFMKAYTLVELKQCELSLLYLFNAKNIPQKWSGDSNCLYLHSCILTEQEKYFEALEELSKISPLDSLASLAMYKICEICHKIKPTAFGSSSIFLSSLNNSVKLQSVLNELHLKSLKILVNICSKTSVSCLSQNFEYNVLYYLLPKINKSLMDILCMLARILANGKEYEKSSHYYMKILSMIENVPQVMEYQNASVNRLTIASLRTVFHEAVSVLIYSDQIANAETICMVPATYFLINKGEINTCGENFFLNLDVDIVALMLLAEIFRRKGLEKKRHKLLNRSLKHLLNYLLLKKTEGQPSTGDIVNSVHRPNLIEALIARIYLYKAILHLKMKYNRDAAINFSRAQQFNSGDECVVYYRKYFTELSMFGLLKHPQDSIIPQNVKNSSLAVNIILELNTDLLSNGVDISP